MESISKRLTWATETVAITERHVNVAGDILLFSPWIYKIALGTWVDRRERFYLQVFVGLN